MSAWDWFFFAAELLAYGAIGWFAVDTWRRWRSSRRRAAELRRVRDAAEVMLDTRRMPVRVARLACLLNTDLHAFAVEGLWQVIFAAPIDEDRPLREVADEVYAALNAEYGMERRA